MLWARVRHFGLRLVVAVLAIIAVLYVSVRAYVGYEVHRAMSMLAEASRLQIGAAEATVLPMVKRYGGFKWTPEPLPPGKDCMDPEECDYERNLLSDYRYGLEVSPFRLVTTEDFSAQRGRVTLAIRTAINAVPAHLRGMLGMRDWGATVDLAIRGGRVQSVSGVLLVEGRSEWIGHEWRLASAMPRREMQAKAFVVETGFLEMENGGGMMIQDIFTPEASEEAVQAARKFNVACLTSIRGCDGFCDMAPRTIEYLKQHPEMGGNIIPPKCQ